ncbi:hypothetical protein SO802_011719 [Lithocarpus litseifolius]|uniref:Uncharacterized protein n=1 Tax=Lithocarpus litseifolius TaxID=425828 RepID=A0AAW2D0T9_9ROSI
MENYLQGPHLAFEDFGILIKLKALRKFESGLNLFQVCGQLSQKFLLGSVVLHD